MKIGNEFTVEVPVDEAWDLLTDIERIAPCMPGAQLTGREGVSYQGKMKVKVGPVTSAFAGTALFVQKDAASHRAVIDAKGRDSRGGGNVAATITAQLRADGPSRTVVSVDTDMKISGKLAQFGSGVIKDVSNKLLGQFVDALERELLGAPPEAVPTLPTTAPALGFQPTAEPQAVDLTELAGGALAKRLVPVVLAVVLVVLLVHALRRRR